MDATAIISTGLAVVLAVCGLIGFVYRTLASKLDALESDHSLKLAAIQKEVSDYKVQVAMTYTNLAYSKDIEIRTSNAMTRIDGKLDRIEERVNSLLVPH